MINASCKDELESKLKNIDISVPSRGEGRTTDDCERSAICHFLSTLNQVRKIEFPLEVEKRERPDFYILSGGKEFGIEHTEAIPPDYAKAMAIAEREKPDAMIDISLFKFGEQKPLDEIRRIIHASELMGDGWAGNSAEVELADAIKNVILGKTEKLKKDGFDKYERNVLLIYENMPRPRINYEILINKCKKSLFSYWENQIIFNDIYVESGDFLILFNHQESISFNVVNLW